MSEPSSKGRYKVETPSGFRPALIQFCDEADKAAAEARYGVNSFSVVVERSAPEAEAKSQWQVQVTLAFDHGDQWKKEWIWPSPSHSHEINRSEAEACVREARYYLTNERGLTWISKNRADMNDDAPLDEQELKRTDTLKALQKAREVADRRTASKKVYIIHGKARRPPELQEWRDFIGNPGPTRTDPSSPPKPASKSSKSFPERG